MKIFEYLLPTLPEGQVTRVYVGLFWIAVELERNGSRSCGLAATMANCEFEHARLPAITEAGALENRPASELARMVFSKSHTEAGIGLATINALLPDPEGAGDLPAEEYIARHGSGSQVALIGHFPFVSQLKEQVKQLWVLELNPQEGDLPAAAAPNILPQADILAVTATALMNHTFDDLFALRKPDARVLLLGPSTPLSQNLFDYGIHVLSGSVVENIDEVTRMVRQGATFRQMRKHGIRLVTMEAKKE